MFVVILMPQPVHVTPLNVPPNKVQCVGLPLERPTKLYSVVDQPGLVGPFSTLFGKALSYG